MQTRSLFSPVSPRHGRGAFAGALLVIAAACTDSPVAPRPEPELPGQNLAKLECRVDVSQGSMSCQTAAPPAGVHGDELPIGGQGIYVRLANGAISYDAGAEITSFNVTVQNLLQQAMGTDGVTTTGIKVVFPNDPVAVGGIVTLANPDGTSDFLYSDEEYFEYAGALEPYQISAAKTWQFNHPASVTSFTFQVYVVTPLANTSSISLLDKVWTGAVSSAWENGLNWAGGVAPDATSTVAIPSPSALAPGASMPVLGGNTQVANLLVASGSTLGLAGFTLEASGNVDAVGTIGGGTVKMTSATGLLRGNVDAAQVTGSVALQGAVKATGAVSVSDGKLTVAGHALSISLP